MNQNLLYFTPRAEKGGGNNSSSSLMTFPFIVTSGNLTIRGQIVARTAKCTKKKHKEKDRALLTYAYMESNRATTVPFD